MKQHRFLPSFRTLLIIIVVVAYTLILSTVVTETLEQSRTLHIPSFATIYVLGYEAYGGDIALKDGNQTLDWGTIYVGTSTNLSFYLRSKSSTITTPTLNVTDWSFRNQQDQNVSLPPINNISITWNATAALTPNQEVYATLTMEIPSDNSFVNYLITNQVKTFSFEIQIYPSIA